MACSQEVVRRAQANVRDLGLAGCRVELEEIILDELVNLHYGGFVTASVAVVGCGENRDDVALVCPVVSVHDKLMRTCDSSQAVRVVELLRDVLSEGVTSASGRDTPTTTVIGVRPEQVTDGALVGGLLDAIELTNLVKCINARGETTVQTEDLAGDHGRQGQVIEKLCELLPHVGVAVLTQALIVESIPIRIRSNN